MGNVIELFTRKPITQAQFDSIMEAETIHQHDDKLEAAVDRFIKCGMKYSRFSKAIYEMLHIDTNLFIAHFDRWGFYCERFTEDPVNTAQTLRKVKDPYLKELCYRLADAIVKREKMKKVGEFKSLRGY